jgi:hypothetical protein
MEKGVTTRLVISLFLAVAAAATAAAAQDDWSKRVEDFEKRYPRTEKNAAAEEVEQLSLALGIDWSPASEGEHPTKEDGDEYLAAGFNTWLDAQVRTSDDLIAAPPPSLTSFLEKRQGPLWKLTGRLESDTPRSNYDARKFSSPRGDLLPTLRLHRLLLSAALVEERAGRHVEAGRLLEASWSLQQFLSERPDFPSQMIVVAMDKSLAGALRKMGDLSFDWSTRMSSDRSWKALLDSFENEPLVVHSGGQDGADKTFLEVLVRGWRLIAENIRDLGPCRASKLSADDFWKPMDEELKRAGPVDGTDPETTSDVFKGISSANNVQTLRRAARLAVDQELTAKILELRQAKAADREGRRPERLVETSSRVCHEASYEYRTRGNSMMIRFKGDVTAPDSPALVLPLSFEVRGARPPRPDTTPGRTPVTAPPALTPTSLPSSP